MPFLIASWCEPENAVYTRSPTYGWRGCTGRRLQYSVARRSSSMSEMSRHGSMPWLNRFIASVTTSTLPVRSPLPNSVPSIAVRAGHHAELGRGDRAAAIVVRVQAQHDLVAVLDVAVEPLDDVAVDVGRVHLDRGGQVQDQLAVDRRLDDVHDRFADLEREVGLGAGEALGRVLVADVGARHGALQLAAPARGVGGDLDDARVGPGRRRRGAAARRSSCRSGRSRAARRCRHSNVRSISSRRHWVSTWMVTSSGIRSSSMSWRMKS